MNAQNGESELGSKKGHVFSLKVCRYVNFALLVLVSFFFFLIPGFNVVRDLRDPNIRSAGIPGAAWRLHRNVSPKFEAWARARLDSARPTQLSLNDISGTEWPLFGAVFYLWATESLQEVWEKERGPGAIAPNIYARGAIDAATSLVLDPNQANWVKTHWGEGYLKSENVFYRMLIISALTSHGRLTGEKHHLPLLREQVEDLSAELDASPYGLLDDYPGQCYPGDVLTAIAMIRKADKLLGTDHSTFVSRAFRGFHHAASDERGLVPYSAHAPSGRAVSPTRGCGNAYVSLFSPQIWPEQAEKWYELYAQFFWQERWGCAGFREFPNDLPGKNWYADVDAGPVLGGFGCAACAFGVGAARANGHFEHAYPLTAQLLATSWPLPNGTWLIPRLLSNAADAPYLGEVAILFNLTRVPSPGITITTGGSIPKFVVMFLTLQIAGGLALLGASVGMIRFAKKQFASVFVAQPGLQFTIWAALVGAGAVCVFVGMPLVGMLLLACALFFPRYRRRTETKMALAVGIDRCKRASMKWLGLFYKPDTAATMLALGFASVVCVALVMGRIAWTGKMRYAFLVWNLFLAWLPLFFAILGSEYFKSGTKRNWRFAMCSVAWLLFFPNAPYIFTDLIHLTNRYLAHFWVDLSLILICAFTGLVLGFVSLYLMQSVVALRHGRAASWFFVAAVAGLSSFGVYLGRFLRFNSWDVLFKPVELYDGINRWASDPLANANTFAFPALFATFLFISYVLLHALTHLPKPHGLPAMAEAPKG